MKYIIDEKNNILLKTEGNIELKENERVIEDKDYEHPIFDTENQKIREANREEKILVYRHDVLLDDGEIVDAGKIINIEKPNYDAVWRKEYFGKGYWEKVPTREEICASGDLTVLKEGEKYEDGHIAKVDNPSNEYLRYVWDKNLFVWRLNTTKVELINLRKEKIVKYAELKNEIAILEEFSDEFESDNTIEVVKLQMQHLKKEIYDLLEIVKTYDTLASI